MGITWWQFWELNPHKIKVIAKGYSEKKIEQDAMVHAWVGNYVMSAVGVAVEHCLAGRKAKSEYIKYPMLQQISEDNTEEEKVVSQKEAERNAERIFMQLEIMGANFNNQKS